MKCPRIGKKQANKHKKKELKLIKLIHTKIHTFAIKEIL